MTIDVDWNCRSWTPSSRDWTEDSEHENGRYLNTCLHCKRGFMGHKRRVVCKVCWGSHASGVSNGE